MEFLKRLLGFHKAPPVLVDACLYELDCVLVQVVPERGRRLNKRFWQMKNFLFGKGDREPILEECEELAKEIIEKHVVIQVLLAFPKLSYEERKSFTQVFCTLLTRDHSQFATNYMVSQEGRDILLCIINGCGDPEIGIYLGIMLRRCISIRCIHEILLKNVQLVEPLFTKYALDDNFDISSDVFQSIHDFLRKNKQLVSSYLHPSKPLNQQIMTWCNNLIQSNKYITTRIMVRILGDFLIDKINFDIMIHYVNSADHLKIFMNLLLSDYPSIQFDAFNVFKIFVVNPDKDKEVERILKNNRDELIDFLGSFLPNKDNEEVFIEEKRLLLSVLRKLA